MSAQDDTFEPNFSCGPEIYKRAREVQLLLNIISPDPEYQPFLMADEATARDVALGISATIQARLEFYFGTSLPSSVIYEPLWKLCDTLKAQFPYWPDEWPANSRFTR